VEGEGYLIEMVDGKYRCSACICCAGQAEKLSEESKFALFIVLDLRFSLTLAALDPVTDL
jgi:hypothetical protein